MWTFCGAISVACFYWSRPDNKTQNLEPHKILDQKALQILLFVGPKNFHSIGNISVRWHVSKTSIPTLCGYPTY